MNLVTLYVTHTWIAIWTALLMVRHSQSAQWTGGTRALVTGHVTLLTLALTTQPLSDTL